MEFLIISSLGMTYRYVAKIEQKIQTEKASLWIFELEASEGAPKPQNQGYSQGMVTQEKLTNPQAKSNIVKPKKEAGKWCEFHKSPTYNTSECQDKQSLMAEIKDYESDAYSNTKS